MYSYSCIHLSYFTLPMITVNDCPNDQFLNKYVRTKVCAAGADKWWELGIVLMGQDAAADLDVIKIDHPNNVMECCSKMFNEWRRRCPKASYKHLIDGLKEINLIQLASEVEKLLIPSAESCVEEKSEITLSKLQHLEKPEPPLGGNHHSLNT